MRAWNFKDLTGMTFGYWKVIKLYEMRNKRTFWLCECRCGKIKPVQRNDLLCNTTKSCGCFRKELRGLNIKPYAALFKHFERTAKKSCHVCEITYDDFLNFTKIQECHYCNCPITWVKDKKGVGAYNLDRKDSSLGYTLENVVVCCKRCNYGKNALFSYEEWKAIGTFIQSNKNLFKGDYVN